MILATCFAAAALSGRPQVPTWTELKEIYRTPDIPASDLKSTSVIDSDYDVTDLEFTSSGVGKAHGTLIRPRGFFRSPLILLMHGLGESSSSILKLAARPLLSSGYAVLALDAPHHGMSGTDQDRIKINAIGAAWYFGSGGGLVDTVFKGDDDRHSSETFLTETVQNGVRDYERALSLLSKNAYLDLKRCGAFGYSLGSLMAGVLGGVDSRVQSVFLAFGGDPVIPYLDQVTEQGRRLRIASCCPSLFLADSPQGATDIPNPCYVSLMSGSADTVIPQSAADRVFDVVTNAEMIRVKADHFSTGLAVEPAIRWFDRTIVVPSGVSQRRARLSKPPEWRRSGATPS